MINIKRGVAHSSSDPADLGSSPLFQRPTSNQEIQISQQWWQQNPIHGGSELKTQIAWLIPIPRNARAHKISAQPMQTSENPAARWVSSKSAKTVCKASYKSGQSAIHQAACSLASNKRMEA
ncbi:hypothetical protein ACLOJK_023986, partial [Asimina triloba]